MVKSHCSPKSYLFVIQTRPKACFFLIKLGLGVIDYNIMDTQSTLMDFCRQQRFFSNNNALQFSLRDLYELAVLQLHDPNETKCVQEVFEMLLSKQYQKMILNLRRTSHIQTDLSTNVAKKEFFF